jgi:hypothetical protein
MTRFFRVLNNNLLIDFSRASVLISAQSIRASETAVIAKQRHYQLLASF